MKLNIIFRCLSVLLLLSTCVFFSGCSSSSSSKHSSQQQSAKKQKSYYDVNIDSLISEAESNAAAANRKYKGQNLRILGGRVMNIDSDLYYISLESPYSDFTFMTVDCYIDTDNQRLVDSIMNVRTGQNVIVYGTVTSVGDIAGFGLNLDRIEY